LLTLTLTLSSQSRLVLSRLLYLLLCLYINGFLSLETLFGFLFSISHSLLLSLSLSSQGKSQEILVTGIKVVDLLAPYAKGGKIGLFGGKLWLGIG
jgi:hypothetical protein